MSWLLASHLVDLVTGPEWQFVVAERGDRRSFVLHHDAIFALSWLLGLTKHLDPTAPTDERLIESLPHLPTGESFKAWRSRVLAAPRDAAEAAAMLDFYYCLDWAYLEVERRGAAAARGDRRQRDRPAAVGAGVGGGLPRPLPRPAGRLGRDRPDDLAGGVRSSRRRTASPRRRSRAGRPTRGRCARRSGPSPTACAAPSRSRSSAGLDPVAGRPPRSRPRAWPPPAPPWPGRPGCRPSRSTSSPRWRAVGRDDDQPAVRRRGSGGTRSRCAARTRQHERRRAPSPTGSGPQASASAAPTRGWARAARRSAGFDDVQGEPDGRGVGVEHARRGGGPCPAPTSTTSPGRAYAASGPVTGAKCPAARNASRAATIAAVSPLCGRRPALRSAYPCLAMLKVCPRGQRRAGRRRRSDRRGTPGSTGTAQRPESWILTH